MHFATHPCVSRVPNKVAATTITTTKKKNRSKYKKGKKKNERKKIANIYIYIALNNVIVACSNK